jgi:Recombinase
MARERWRASRLIHESSPQILEAREFINFLARPLYKDKIFLTQKYIKEGLSITQIASQIFSSRDAVRRGLIEAEIHLRTPHRPHGHPSQAKFGEKVRKGKAVEHMAEQRVVKAIMDMRRDGMTLRQIAAYLTQIGVPTKCRGKGWHPEMVSRILQSVNLARQARALQTPEECSQEMQRKTGSDITP